MNPYFWTIKLGYPDWTSAAYLGSVFLPDFTSSCVPGSISKTKLIATARWGKFFLVLAEATRLNRARGGGDGYAPVKV